jgi:hypothetical protein
MGHRHGHAHARTQTHRSLHSRCVCDGRWTSAQHRTQLALESDERRHDRLQHVLACQLRHELVSGRLDAGRVSFVTNLLCFRTQTR